MITFHHPVAVPAPRKSLSREQFERMCYQAAKNSGSCRGYIRGVLKNVCLWLDSAGGDGALRPQCEPGRGNVQKLIIFLYRLLEEKCACDFHIEEVLNAYSAGGHSSSDQNGF